jgi:hypothetical protein
VRQAHVLGEVVVGTDAQAGDDVEVAVAGGKEKDRHRRRQRPQVAAEREAAVDVVAEADVDQGQIRQASAECGQRIDTVVVGHHRIALPRKHVTVVGADRGLVLDDGDAPGHLRRSMPPNIAQPRDVAASAPRNAILLPQLFVVLPPFPPAADRIGD